MRNLILSDVKESMPTMRLCMLPLLRSLQSVLSMQRRVHLHPASLMCQELPIRVRSDPAPFRISHLHKMRFILRQLQRTC